MARRYARDNRGRFTSSGGATARGGRLRTASGNKRQAQKMKLDLVYHGTKSKEAAASIKAKGYKPSRDGAMGAGVYMSTNKKEAQFYAGKQGKVMAHRLQVERAVNVKVPKQNDLIKRHGQAAKAMKAGRVARQIGRDVLVATPEKANRSLVRDVGKVRRRRRSAS